VLISLTYNFLNLHFDRQTKPSFGIYDRKIKYQWKYAESNEIGKVNDQSKIEIVNTKDIQIFKIFLCIIIYDVSYIIFY